MTYRVWMGLFCLSIGSITCEQRDYKEQLEAAIIRTDLAKVQRLLTRKNKLSVKRFNDMLGWAEDVIEERRMLDLTVREKSLATLSKYLSYYLGFVGSFYYFDWWGSRRSVKDGPLGEQGFKIFLGSAATLTAFGFYKSYMGPRKRLDDAFSVLFELEDTVEGIKEKKNAQKVELKEAPSN